MISMSILANIKSDQLIARKMRDKVKTDFLTSLIGEAERVGKNDGNRVSTDDEVLAVIKKAIKNADETLSLVKDKRMIEEAAGLDDIIAALALEIETLKGYLPKQLSEAVLREAINEMVCSGMGLGGIMRHLKHGFGGHYDGKLASAIAKEMLGDD